VIIRLPFLHYYADTNFLCKSLEEWLGLPV
jgi:hypothetical protein